MDASLRGSSPGRSRSELDPDRTRDSGGEDRWKAALMSAELAPQRPRPMVAPGTNTRTALPDLDAATQPWRSTAEALTATRVNVATRADDAGAEAPATTMTLRIDAGPLGAVAVGLQQGETGTRVVLGAEHEAAAERLRAELPVLEQALSASGVKVESLRIVRATHVGTLLALPPDKQSAPTDSRPGPETPPRESGPKRRRRLDLTG